MALILNIETSSTVCSVSLANNGHEVAYRADPNANSHARVLTVFIDEMLKSSQVDMQQLDAVAVSAGPGSYTGLRIGASVAKGLCYALNKPLISVSTLQAIAMGVMQQVKKQEAYYMPVTDARRMDIYTALFNAEGKQLLPPYFATINTALQEKLSRYPDIYLGGSAWEKCKDFFTTRNIYVVEGIDADARLLAHLAQEKYNSSAFEDVAYFEPFYLKEFGD